MQPDLGGLEQCVYWELYRYLNARSIRELAGVSENAYLSTQREHFECMKRRSKNIEQIVRYREKMERLYKDLEKGSPMVLPLLRYTSKNALKEVVLETGSRWYPYRVCYSIISQNSISYFDFRQAEGRRTEGFVPRFNFSIFPRKYPCVLFKEIEQDEYFKVCRLLRAAEEDLYYFEKIALRRLLEKAGIKAYGGYALNYFFMFHNKIFLVDIICKDISKHRTKHFIVGFGEDVEETAEDVMADKHDKKYFFNGVGDLWTTLVCFNGVISYKNIYKLVLKEVNTSHINI
jgi:hypothetical protein